MKSFITKAALAPVAASFVLMLAASVPASVPASAQLLTNGPDGQLPNTLKTRSTYVRKYRNPLAMNRRPLTVRRAGAAPVVAAAAAPAAVGANPVTGVLGIGSAVVGLPFQVLGGILPGAPAFKGGVTAVRYEGARDKVAEIDEGWAQAVPVNRSGPVYVVENGDGMASPLALVGLPIRAVGTVAQAPFRVLGAPFGGTPGLLPSPTF